MSDLNDTDKDWIIQDEDGQQAILIAKNIRLFSETLRDAKYQNTMKKMRDKFMDALNYIEFAPVIINRKGVVRWQSGDFVGDEGKG